jgi:hypothetical protein
VNCSADDAFASTLKDSPVHDRKDIQNSSMIPLFQTIDLSL